MSKDDEICCDDCGSKEYELDQDKGVRVCAQCGIESELSANEEVSNSNALFGENRHREVVSGGGRGFNPGIGTQGSRLDLSGLPAKQNKEARRIHRAGLCTTRTNHPIFEKVRAIVQELYGKDVALAVDPVLRMMCLPLTTEQQAARDKLNPAEKKCLRLPKQAICRLKQGTKGDNERQNLLILALTAVEYTASLDRTIQIPRMGDDLNRFGLTRKQILKAKSIVKQHHNARMRNGMAIKAGQNKKMVEAKLAEDRENKLDEHLDAAFKNLSSKLTEEKFQQLVEEVKWRLNALGEPSLDSLTCNTAINVVVGCVMLAALEAIGVHDKKLAGIAAKSYRSGSGVRARLEQFREAEESGKGNYNNAFD